MHCKYGCFLRTKLSIFLTCSFLYMARILASINIFSSRKSEEYSWYLLSYRSHRYDFSAFGLMMEKISTSNQYAAISGLIENYGKFCAEVDVLRRMNNSFNAKKHSHTLLLERIDATVGI